MKSRICQAISRISSDIFKRTSLARVHCSFMASMGICFLTLCLVALPTLVTPARAQSGEIDLDGPIVEHDAEDYSNDDPIQVFAATVVDNDSVKSVRLFYRFDSESDFKDVDMKPIAQSSVYTTSIDTAGSDASTIEYYIQAEDSAGIVVLEGYAFNPLTRELGLDDSTLAGTDGEQPELVTGIDVTDESGDKDSALIDQPAEPTQSQPAPVATRSSKVLYYVIGAIAVGTVAALAASGGSDDSGDSIPSGDDPCCTVTVQIADP